jgi:hypothetical protein
MVNENRLVQYQLSPADIKGECRINHLLEDRLEEEFYEHIPIKDEGHAITTKEVGMQFDKEQRQIVNNNKTDMVMKKYNLKDTINSTRGYSTGVKGMSK